MYRETKQRRRILEILQGTTIHPTADWVYAQLKPEFPRLSLGTVYRNLRILVDRGELLELNVGTCSHFDGNLKPHYHFRCKACGRIYDVDMPVMEGLDQKVSQATGFLVERHNLEFVGLCLECRREKGR